MSAYYAFEDTLGTGLLYSLTQLGVSSLFAIATYVMTALALYTIAKRRGLHNPWLAWIPVASFWLLGSISDQFRYVTLGQNKAKRKWLLGLNITSSVLGIAIVCMGISVVVNAIFNTVNFYDEEAFLRSVLGSAISMLALLVPLLAVNIAAKVLGYMAKYDIYKSLDPANCVLYLVLSIFFPVTEPFFLIFNRNKDLGMPPRKPEPTPAPDFIDPPQYL